MDDMKFKEARRQRPSEETALQAGRGRETSVPERAACVTWPGLRGHAQELNERSSVWSQAVLQQGV